MDALLVVAPVTDILLLVPQIIFRDVEVIHGVDKQLLVNLEAAVHALCPLPMDRFTFQRVTVFTVVEVTRHTPDIQLQGEDGLIGKVFADFAPFLRCGRDGDSQVELSEFKDVRVE